MAWGQLRLMNGGAASSESEDDEIGLAEAAELGGRGPEGPEGRKELAEPALPPDMAKAREISSDPTSDSILK